VLYDAKRRLWVYENNFLDCWSAPLRVDTSTDNVNVRLKHQPWSYNEYTDLL
jgi:hypothetical protein